MHASFRLFVILLAMTVVGCASRPLIQSSLASRTSIDEGVLYSLPMQFVKVEYTRNLIDSTKAAAAQKKAKDEVVRATKNLGDKDAEIKQLEQTKGKVDANAPNAGEALAKLDLKLTKAKAEKLVLSQQLSEKKQQFADATTLYARSLSSDEAFNEQLKITALPPVPDPEFAFKAQVQHQSRDSDAVELKVKNGLLDGAVGFSEDKTSEIIVSLVGGLTGMQHLAQAQKVLNLAPAVVPPGVTCKKERVVSISGVIDPQDATGDLADLNALLHEKGCISIAVTLPQASISSSSDISVPVSGLVYRHPAVFEFKVIDANSSTVLQSFKLSLAQGGPIGVINFPKGNLAKNEYDVVFSNGLLTRSKITQPSEVLGAAMIIPNALRAIFAIPTELIQLKVNYSSSEKELIELKKAMLEAQVAIESKQAEFDALLAAEASP